MMKKNFPYSKNMRGDPKIPRIVKKNLFKIFIQVWNFSLLQSTLPCNWMQRSQVLLPMLETLPKIFNNNAVKGSQQFLLNLCNFSKTPPFQILIHPWEQKKSSKERGQASRGVGHNHHFVFSQNGGILLMLQRFNKTCWWPLTVFPLKILNSVSSSGSGSGTAATSHRRSIPKGTKVSNLYEYFKQFFLTISGIFGKQGCVTATC